MYYSYRCPDCGRLFYVINSNKYKAAETLYDIVKSHLINYNQDDREHTLDDGKVEDSQQILSEMTESNEKPAGGYEA